MSAEKGPGKLVLNLDEPQPDENPAEIQTGTPAHFIALGFCSWTLTLGSVGVWSLNCFMLAVLLHVVHLETMIGWEAGPGTNLYLFGAPTGIVLLASITARLSGLIRCFQFALAALCLGLLPLLAFGGLILLRLSSQGVEDAAFAEYLGLGALCAAVLCAWPLVSFSVQVVRTAG